MGSAHIKQSGAREPYKSLVEITCESQVVMVVQSQTTENFHQKILPKFTLKFYQTSNPTHF